MATQRRTLLTTQLVSFLLCRVKLTLSYSHQRAFYNKNYVYVSGENKGSPATFTVPANCYFARFSVAVAAWTTFQVEQGSSATSYVPYGYVINSDYLPASEVSSARLDPFLTIDGAPKINPYKKNCYARRTID